MALENKICDECEKLRLILIEKNNEIEKLKLHIQNLTNYLLCKDNNHEIQQNVHDPTFTVESIENTMVEQFYSNELFFKSCDRLNKHALLKSKSVQTDNSENSSLCHENVTKNPEEHQVEEHPDYVYDKNYQMYYSLSTGYYYDDKSGLMYEPQSGTYLKYNYDKEEYEKLPVQEGTNDNVHEDKKASNYICETVVDQVSNLNLNDETVEKFESEVKNQNATEENYNVIDDEEINAAPSGNDTIALGCAKDWQLEEGSKLTVTDMVKQVVEEHSNMSDYIYDDLYRMYYSPSTGYFYDAVRNLLYDPTSGIYYSYDSANQKYEFYCQTSSNIVENNQTAKEENINKDKLASRRKYWKKKLELSQRSPKSPRSDEDDNSIDLDEEFSDPEEGEIFSSDEEPNTPITIVKSPVKSPSSRQTNTEESFPPSIRAIVETSENLQIGSLILITCSGGIIGRDKTNAVYLPDICVSKIHANITFNSDFQTYSIEDLGSQNGTFINDKRLSEPKLKSEPYTLNHGDKLSLGSCKLLLHIHEGYDTCDNCEPGQVLAELASHTEKTAVIVSKEEKEKLRREEVRRLKKKYGLRGANFEQKRTPAASKGYEDKAEIRRQTVGSDNPYEKTEEASVDISMPQTNKGYQMLKKMGWKEGQTLGTTDSGLVEPNCDMPPSKKARRDSLSKVSTIDRPSIPQPATSGIHLKDLKKSLNCPLCDSKFQRKNHFFRHMRWHESHAASSSTSSMEISEDEALPEVRTVECQPEALQSSDNEVHPEMTTSKERSELTGASTHIPLRPWTGTAGLGSSDQPSSRPQSEDKKAKKWVKAQERYFQLSLRRDTS